MYDLLIHNAAVITLDNEEMIDNGFVLVHEGRFIQVSEGPPPLALKEKAVNIKDAKGKWLLSGFFNTHCHTPMSILRGAADDLPLDQWLKEEVWPREKFLDKDMIHAGTSLALVEMIRSGTVGFLDMYHLHMDIVAEAVVEAGLKGALSRGMIALGFTPQELKDKLNEAAVLAKGWESHESKRLKGFLFPHAPYTCTPDFLEAVADRARSENLPLSIHLAETKKEVARHEEEYGKRPVEHLDDLGFFESPVLAAHGVHVNSFEIKLLTDKNVSVSHNPLSNLKLGSGVAPVGEMMKQGLHLSIGTDSVVSNNNLDMFQEVRTAAILQKGFFHDASLVTAREALQMGTIHGAKAAGFTESGLIKEGYEADFILVDSSKPHLQPVENRVSHLVYSASGQDVTDVFVNGRAVMRNKELITLDEEKIVYEANNQYRRLNGLYRN